MAKPGPLELHQAIWNHDIQKVREILEKGADPNHLTGGRSHLAGQTPLFLAISRAMWEVSESNKQLHEAAAELSLKMIHPNTEASRATLLQIIRLLIESGADLNKRSPSRSPLNLAADEGDVEIVQILLQAGADPAGVSYSIASKLSHRNGRKFVEGYYDTALHSAAAKGKLEVAKSLVAAGAEMSALDHENNTPEQVALERGHKEVAEFLRAMSRHAN